MTGTAFVLEAYDIFKAYEGQSVLQGISLRAEEGEILALLGPSGCGKTTLLRIIAGLEIADRGNILLTGDDLTQIPVHKRGFGMVFQDYALFPHKNVWHNVAFALRMLGWSRERIERRVQEVLMQVGMAEFAERSVHELSGGEQQRVALARALAPSPRLLLMDEPLGSLDRALRERLMSELRSILKKASRSEANSSELTPGQVRAGDLGNDGFGAKRGAMTSIYVTHDQEEAFAIADRILIMNQGRVEQEGAPLTLYREPETVFVARFLGMENMFEVEVVRAEPQEVKWFLGRLRLGETETPVPLGKATLLIRPEAASLTYPEDDGLNILDGELQDVSFRGQHQIAHIKANGSDRSITLKFSFQSTVALPAAPSTIRFRLDPAQLRLLAA